MQKQPLFFLASDGVQDIELQTGDGHIVSITDRANKQLLAETGALLEAESLIYQNDTEVQEEVVTHTLSTPRGKNFKLVLEDGTEVWLNAESKLHYPNRFTGKERKVTLEGEAFFQLQRASRLSL